LNPRDINEHKNDNPSTETTTEDPSDYSDSYDEKMARNAVGWLFTGDDTDDNDGDYDPPSVRITPRAASASEASDDEYYAALKNNRQARGDRSRPVTQTPLTASAAPRKIDRPIRTNPEPKPAMKARVPVVREPISARRVERIEDPDVSAPFEDDVNNFKARYTSRDALATATNPGKADPDDRILHPVGARTRSRATPAPPSEYNSYQVISPVRWVALVGVVMVLVFMIVLAFQNRSLRNERNELIAAAENAPPPPVSNNVEPGNNNQSADLTEMQLHINELEENLAIANADIRTLENWLRTQGYNPEHVYNPPPPESTPPPTTPDPTPSPPPPAYDIYVVVRGDTLSGIAQKFYGSSAEVHWRRIMEANGMTNDRISVDQELRIPRI